PGDNPDTITIGGVAATAGATVTGSHGVLTVTAVDSVNHTVSYSYTLTSPLSVAGAGTNNEGAGDTFAVVVTDVDGSTANASLVVDVIDDVPSMHAADTELGNLVVSETHLTAATNSVDGSAPDLAQTHVTTGFANAFTSVAGADGGSLSYALTVNGAASGLVDSQTGQNVVLVLNNGVVEGHVGASDGLLSFTLAVDSTGHVTLTQDRAVSQADAASPDTGEGVGLAHGVVNLVGTITDGDGD